MIDVAKARACLLSNLLVLPGLGSLVGDRRIGWVQIPLAALGLCTSGTGAILSFLWIKKNHEAMAEGVTELSGLMLPLGVAVGGLVIFAAAWLWGLSSGLSLLQEAKRAAATPPTL